MPRRFGTEAEFIHVLPDTLQWMGYEHRSTPATDSMLEVIRKNATQ